MFVVVGLTFVFMIGDFNILSRFHNPALPLYLERSEIPIVLDEVANMYKIVMICRRPVLSKLLKVLHFQDVETCKIVCLKDL